MLRTILLVGALSGCSVALQRKPTSDGAARDCSTSAVYPVLDMVEVAASVGLLVASIVKADEWGDGGSALGGAAVLNGVVFTASGVEGFRARSECRRARKRMAPVAAR